MGNFDIVAHSGGVYGEHLRVAVARSRRTGVRPSILRELREEDSE
jgi:septum formation topological specificity factor MinE